MAGYSILFWLLLLLPGYALLTRCYQEKLEAGLLGVIALSYLLSFGIFCAASIPCYILQAPVIVFSAAVLLAIVLAFIDLARRKQWRFTATLLLTGITFECLFLVTDMALGARLGAYLGGDACIHMARIRFILDEGFNNLDPFVDARHFFPIYHTNLLHALMAVCIQVTRCDLTAVWFDSLPFAKLLVATGSYYLAWTVFRRKWVAAVAAVFVIAVRGPFSYLIYPNQLSPYYLTPMMLACVVDALREKISPRSVALVALGSIVLGQFHGLYVLFCMLALGPLIASVALWRIILRKNGRLPTAALALAISAGFPFLLVSKIKTPVANTAPVTEAAAISDDGYFVRVGDRFVMRNPAALVETLGGGVGNSLAWLAGIACALASRRRREAALVLAVLLTTLVIFYFPPLCTFILKRLGEEWVMQRFDFFFGICQIVLVPGAIAALIDAGRPNAVLRSLVSAAAFFLGILSTRHVEPDDWKTYFLSAQATRPERFHYFNNIYVNRDFVHECIPQGETVLTDDASARAFAMIGNYKVVYSVSGSNGVPDLLQRRDDLNVMLNPATPWEVRLPLLKKYNTRYFFPTKPPIDWTHPHIESFWERNKRLIIKLKLE